MFGPRRKIVVGMTWCRFTPELQIFTVKEIKDKGKTVILTDITGLFRTTVSTLTYYSMIRKAQLLTPSEEKEIRNKLSQILDIDGIAE